MSPAWTARRALAWWMAARQRGDEANDIRVRFMVLGWLAMSSMSLMEAVVEAREQHAAGPALATAMAALALLFANRAELRFAWLVHLTLLVVVIRFEVPLLLGDKPTPAAIVWSVMLPVIASIAIGLRAALFWLGVAVVWLWFASTRVAPEILSASNLSGFFQLGIAVLSLAFAFVVLDREHRRSNDRLQRAIAARELVLAKLSHEAKTPLHQVINALDSQVAEGATTPHIATALQAAGQLSAVLQAVFQQARETSTPEPKPAPPPAVVLSSRLEEARVLVVDDNPLNLRMAVAMLERLGCRVTPAAGGLEAVEAVLGNGFDLVVMDCHMPEVDGFEATRRIRGAKAGVREVPIIALTASSDPEDANRARAAGMNAFLEKPLRLKDLERLLL